MKYLSTKIATLQNTNQVIQDIWSLLEKIPNFGNQPQSDKSELNMTQMIPTQFFSKIKYDKDFDEFRYIPTRETVRLSDDRNIIYHEATRKCYQYHDTTNSMTVDVKHCLWGLGSCCARTKC